MIPSSLSQTNIILILIVMCCFAKKKLTNSEMAFRNYLIYIRFFKTVFDFLLNLFLVTSAEGEKSNGAKVYAHQMVRTDSREQTLHAFLPPKDHPVKSNESNKYVQG